MKNKKFKLIIFTMALLVGIVFSTPKINAQTTVDVYINYFIDDIEDESLEIYIVVDKGDTISVDALGYGHDMFMHWVVNGVVRLDLPRYLTIRVDNDLYLEAHVASEAYYNGYQKGLDDGFDDGYDYGYDIGFDNGYGYGHDDGYGYGYDDGYGDGYGIGYDYGYDNGFDASETFNFASLLTQVFVGIGSLLAIEILPNISIGTIIAVPLVFGIIYFIIGKRGGV